MMAMFCSKDKPYNEIFTVKTTMKNYSSITLLRLVCCWEVFLLHWFPGIGLRDYLWIWSGAVPCFLLVSAFIYGLRPVDKQTWGIAFILKRWKSLAVTYYPFVVAVFAWYAISDFTNIGTYSLSVFGELLFATNAVKSLPGCGHLWFMQTLMLCYLLLAVICKSEKYYAIFKKPKTVIILILFTFLIGGEKRQHFCLSFVLLVNVYLCQQNITI